MRSAAWHLEPQLSVVIAAAMTLLAVVLAATLVLGIGELLARRERRAERFYVGHFGRVFVVDRGVRPLIDASADPDAWDLARSVLRDVRGCDPAPDQVRRFVDEVVSRLPEDGFVLEADHVEEWLT